LYTTPDILECIYFKQKGSYKDLRHVHDYELDFYINGNRDMYIDEKYYRISKGTLVFRKPGQVVESCGDYDVYTLTLDFSHQVNIPPEKYLRHENPHIQSLCHNEIFDIIPSVFLPYHQSEIQNLMQKLTECSYPNPINKNQQQSLISELLLLILSDACRHSREFSKKHKESYVEKACNYINNNYDKNLSIDDIASHLSLNKHYLIRLFKKELSQTPNSYILETRLFYARRMLIQTEFSVKEISFACGFNTPSYFIKCFREKLQKSPSAYRKEYM